MQKLTITLFKEINDLIICTKQQIIVNINSELSYLYWKIGKRINEEILKNKRAKYGQKLIINLSKELTLKFGKGWSDKQLRHCLRIAEIIPQEQIFSTLRRKLSWTHIKTIVYLDDELKREFYIQMSINENWSSRQLTERINSRLYERTIISKKPKKNNKNKIYW